VREKRPQSMRKPNCAFDGLGGCPILTPRKLCFRGWSERSQRDFGTPGWNLVAPALWLRTLNDWAQAMSGVVYLYCQEGNLIAWAVSSGRVHSVIDQD